MKAFGRKGGGEHRRRERLFYLSFCYVILGFEQSCIQLEKQLALGRGERDGEGSLPVLVDFLFN